MHTHAPSHTGTVVTLYKTGRLLMQSKSVSCSKASRLVRHTALGWFSFSDGGILRCTGILAHPSKDVEHHNSRWLAFANGRQQCRDWRQRPDVSMRLAIQPEVMFTVMSHAKVRRPAASWGTS